jgi:hypothetical protein
MIEQKPETRLCDENCNQCPIINHPNSRMITLILNTLHKMYGDETYAAVQKNCPNLTCCFDCRIDDFTHLEDCTITEKAKKDAMKLQQLNKK